MDRVAELEMQVTELTREVEMLKSQASLRTPRVAPRERSASAAGARSEDAPGHASEVSDIPEDDEALTAIVDDAVDRKTKKVLDEMRIKANKKPAMGVFASALELTKEQEKAAERVIVDGQRKVLEILETPTADGANLMDELVETFAKSFARPGQDNGMGRLFMRIASEKIPGTNETYGTRIESVKRDMHTAFKRDWTEAQYKEFEQWGLDPTQIEKVPGSPHDALGKRIIERARALGAEIPEDDGEK